MPPINYSVVKYVMFDGSCPVVFRKPIKHIECLHLKRQATSGGYALIDDGVVHVEGDALSVDLSPKPGDAKILAEFLGLKEG